MHAHLWVYFSHLVCRQHLSLASAFSHSFYVFWSFTTLFWMSLLRPALCVPTNHGFAPVYWRLCGLPREDWDDHLLCTSCRALGDSPCHSQFACPVCVQWPEDKRQRFLPTQNITTGQGSTSFLSPLPRPELTIIFNSHLLALSSALTPTTAWSTLSRSTCHTPRMRISAVAGNAFSSTSQATMTRL